MADSIELRMSVTSIKRVDPYVKNVLATATHVALYSFNTTKNEWEKTETEGALFVYSRNGEPFHSIMIMNRLNTDNLIEPIVKDFDYQMQVPFLLYRNSNSKIFGIWFFNREECIRITILIESLMETVKDKNDEKCSKKGKGADIFSMLTKAQEDFNKTPTKQEGPPTFSSSTPRVPDVTSQSVMDFFAKASSKSSQKPSVPSGSNENVLQRLMSNPAHTVEHIEKQQRAITPQEQPSLKTQSSNMDRRSVPISIPGSSTHIDNSFSIGTSLPQNKAGSVSPLAFMMQSQSQPHSDREGDSLLGSSPFSQFLENSVMKHHLMTPMMFSAGKSGEKLNNSDEKHDQIDLLTEKQLAQALIHLLKNNSDFTKQIHEAYVQSIMEKVNLNNSTNSKSFV